MGEILLFRVMQTTCERCIATAQFDRRPKPTETSIFCAQRIQKIIFKSRNRPKMALLGEELVFENFHM